MPALLHCVRSHHARARIGAVEVADAAAAPSVAAVLTGADLVAAGVKPILAALPMDSFDGTPFHEPTRRALALDVVRFVVEPVAMVPAETPEQAMNAAELLMVDYEELPPVLDPEQLVAAGDGLWGGRCATGKGAANSEPPPMLEGLHEDQGNPAVRPSDATDRIVIVQLVRRQLLVTAASGQDRTHSGHLCDRCPVAMSPAGREIS